MEERWQNGPADKWRDCEGLLVVGNKETYGVKGWSVFFADQPFFGSSALVHCAEEQREAKGPKTVEK